MWVSVVSNAVVAMAGRVSVFVRRVVTVTVAIILRIDQSAILLGGQLREPLFCRNATMPRCSGRHG